MVIRKRLLTCFAMTAALSAAEPEYGFREGRAMVQKYCVACHKAKSSFDATRLRDEQSLQQAPREWSRALTRVRDSEMPPKGAPAPSEADRERWVNWLDRSLRTAACADGIAPRPAMMRRLNRNEYSATMRDLLNIQVNAGRNLPADGAGGEGFDNAAETLFVSPIHAEKFLEAARIGLEYGARDPKSRKAFLVAEPGEGVTEEQAARTILERFVPRAFRRPAREGEVERYLEMFRGALKRGETYEQSILFALQAVLITPDFLFRIEEPNPETGPRLASHYDTASRLSYFLWGSMPDDELFEAAAKGALQDPEELKRQVARMLKDVKTREFAEHFVEQWLGTRELGRDIKPDAKLFPAYYDEEIQSAIRYEPILFFQELVNNDLSLLNLLDSKFTILTNKLQKHYNIELEEKLRQQPKRVELPAGTHRGGLLGMAAVLAVSSYPQRTSPVLRGKWILEAILGAPPAPPPPNVPELKEQHEGEAPRTMKERLNRHRQDPACASCHNRIDPLGFGLENFNVLGQWRTEDGGAPVDAKGELPDGSSFEGPEELKAVLLTRKDQFVRNLTMKLLGYGLGRGLTLEDYCVVDQIVETLKKEDYRAQTLIREIVLSVPFRYQPGSTPNLSVKQEGDR